ncbi:MAG: DUF4974 domain-containing protein [Odoribacter sp.]
MEKEISTRIQIAKLIAKSVGGDLTDEEKKLLDQWLESDPSHPQLLKNIWQKSVQQMDNKLTAQQEWQKFVKNYSIPQKSFVLKHFMKYAALLCICLAGGMIYYFHPIKNERSLTAIMTPTPSQVVLTLANGETIYLGASQDSTILADSNLTIRQQQGQLIYQNASTVTPGQYNTITVPKYGEYSLQLTDGTQIKLNSETTLRYPVAFSNKSREVWLQGEGYFQVSHQTDAPFTVHLRQGSVNVLGTDFNIEAYPWNAAITTTLIHGSIRYENGQQSKILTPGQQSIVRDGEPNIEIRKVDINIAMAWIHGQFYFKQETLENILSSLSQWYDIEFFYQQEELKHLCFTVETDRFKDISGILNLISETGRVQFRRNGKTIQVFH